MTKELALFFKSNTATKDDFQFFQFFPGRGKFLVYRATLMLIFVGGFVCHLAWSSKHEKLIIYWCYLTHWIELVVVLYFLVSFLVSLKGWLMRNKNGDIAGPQLRETNQTELCLMEISNHQQWIENNIPEDEDKGQIVPANSLNRHLNVKKDNRLSWLDASTWLLHELAFVGSYTVTLIFWLFLRKKNEDIHSTTAVALNIFQHGFNCLVMTIDAIISRYPARLMHAVYGLFLGIFYVLFTFLLHLIRYHLNPNSDIPEKVYWFLDWGSGSFYPLYLCLIMVPVTFLLQSFLLLLNWIRNRMVVRLNR